jgi:3-oxoacyl-(acyl-carrier-protein) synthase
MAVYIQSAVAISPQDTFLQGSLPNTPVIPQGRYFTCIHPDYRNFLNPAALRRMSGVIRMGLTASKVCQEKAGVIQPGAILIGSGLGCLTDTARFLTQMIENREQLLNPTAFIQSTHNTVSGQIALLLGNTAQNLTFSQKTISFESALLEAVLILKEGWVHDVLVGGIDEIARESYEIMEATGCAKSITAGSPDNHPSPGAEQGEGAAFFIFSDTLQQGTLARFDDLEIVHRFRNNEELHKALDGFLSRNGLVTADIDLLISGRNSDSRYQWHHEFVLTLFDSAVIAGYKHLTGEYDTASAFATYLAAGILHTNHVPGAVRLNGATREKISRALLFNYGKDQDFSFVLLSAIDS